MSIVGQFRQGLRRALRRFFSEESRGQHRPPLHDIDQRAETARRLAQEAAAAFASGDRVGSFAFRSSAHAVTSSTDDLVHLLEAARLAGFLPFYEEALAGLGAREIVDVLSPEHASSLAAERDTIARFSDAECEYLGQTLPQVPRQIRARLLRKGFVEGADGVQTFSAPMTSIWDAADESDQIILDHPEICSVPEILVVGEAERAFVPTRVRSGGMLRVKNARAVVSSDLILAHGQWFADYYTWPDSFNNNPINDSQVVDVRPLEQQLSVIRPSTANTLDFKVLAWLAYPMSWAWGHWVPEALTRYAYMLDSGLPPEIPVVVDARVPKVFRDFLHIMNPAVKVVAAESGTQVMCENLWLSPSRVYAAHNPRWSLDELDRRIYAEPVGFRRLRDALLNSSVLMSSLESPPRVLLSRELANHPRNLDNADRFDRAAGSLGFVSIDPGSLGAIEQVSLFRSAKVLCGIDGAQWFLAGVAGQGTRSVIVGHDLCRVSRGPSWVIESLTGVAPAWILGRRETPIPGWGGEVFQQGFSLTATEWNRFEAALKAAVGKA